MYRLMAQRTRAYTFVVSFLLHSLIDAVIGAGLVVALVGVLAVALRRYVRRRWDRLRRHPVTRGMVTSASLAAAWRERRGATDGGSESDWGTSVRLRRRMWVAVEDAEAAVRHATDVDAPVAELPAVCRSLRTVADELDHLLRLERRLPLGPGRPTSVRSQVAELMQASRDVQMAALRAGGDASAPQVHNLVREARNEVEIVAAALARMRSVS
jgi:hypothetical protein